MIARTLKNCKYGYKCRNICGPEENHLKINIKVWSVEGICSTAKKTNGKVVFASMRQSSNQVWGLFSLRLLGTWKEKTGNESKTFYEEDFVVHYSQCEAQMKLSRCYRAKLFCEMDI